MRPIIVRIFLIFIFKLINMHEIFPMFQPFNWNDIKFLSIACHHYCCFVVDKQTQHILRSFLILRFPPINLPHPPRLIRNLTIRTYLLRTSILPFNSITFSSFKRITFKKLSNPWRFNIHSLNKNMHLQEITERILDIMIFKIYNPSFMNCLYRLWITA